MRAIRRIEYLIISGGEVLERVHHLALAENRARVLSESEWRDFTVWSNDGQLLAYAREGELIPTPAVTLAPAA